KPACSRGGRESPPSSADRDRSARPTSPTSSSSWRNSKPAIASSGGFWIAWRLAVSTSLKGRSMGAKPHAIVVGGGIAGASAARFLAAEGLKTCLVEADMPASGASGRNPGFLWLQTKSRGEQMTLALAGRGFADRLRDELDDFGFRACGGLILIRD